MAAGTHPRAYPRADEQLAHPPYLDQPQPAAAAHNLAGTALKKGLGKTLKLALGTLLTTATLGGTAWAGAWIGARTTTDAQITSRPGAIVTPISQEVQPRPANLVAPQQVIIQPEETAGERTIMQNVQQLTTGVNNLADEVHTLAQKIDPDQGGKPPQNTNFITPSKPSGQTPQNGLIPAVSSPPPQATPQLSIWESGNGCWTPKDVSVLHLCGDAAGDGYVIRWVGKPGDNRGPEIPDADWLATHSRGDQLVWSGTHPTTGEMVTINYWSGGHTLVVHAAGRLIFRIDRNHNVQ